MPNNARPTGGDDAARDRDASAEHAFEAILDGRYEGLRSAYSPGQDMFRFRFDEREYRFAYESLELLADKLHRLIPGEPVPPGFDIIFPSLYEDPIFHLARPDAEDERLTILVDDRIDLFDAVLDVLVRAPNYDNVYRTITINRPQVHQCIQVLHYASIIYTRAEEAFLEANAQSATPVPEAIAREQAHMQLRKEYVTMLLHELLHLVTTPT